MGVGGLRVRVVRSGNQYTMSLTPNKPTKGAAKGAAGVRPADSVASLPSAPVEGGARLAIPKTANVGMVIGKGGANIKEVRKRYKVQANLERHVGRDGAQGCVILGEPAAVEAAARAVALLAAGLPLPPK